MSIDEKKRLAKEIFLYYAIKLQQAMDIETERINQTDRCNFRHVSGLFRK
jgi:hypothetical protein